MRRSASPHARRITATRCPARRTCAWRSTDGALVHLTLQEAHAVEGGVARVEASTGVEIVTAVVGKCDGYPEIVWKAFALGTVVAALVVVALDLMRPDWVTAYTVWLCIVTILAAGAVSALVAIAVPEYARLFLDRHRAAGEVRQYARAMFVDR